MKMCCMPILRRKQRMHQNKSFLENRRNRNQYRIMMIIAMKMELEE